MKKNQSLNGLSQREGQEQCKKLYRYVDKKTLFYVNANL